MCPLLSRCFLSADWKGAGAGWFGGSHCYVNYYVISDGVDYVYSPEMGFAFAMKVEGQHICPCKFHEKCNNRALCVIYGGKWWEDSL